MWELTWIYLLFSQLCRFLLRGRSRDSLEPFFIEMLLIKRNCGLGVWTLETIVHVIRMLYLKLDPRGEAMSSHKITKGRGKYVLFPRRTSGRLSTLLKNPVGLVYLSPVACLFTV